MFAIAKLDNKTLHITKGKKYEVYRIGKVGLVSLTNDIGDRVIMSIYDFVIPE